MSLRIGRLVFIATLVVLLTIELWVLRLSCRSIFHDVQNEKKV